MGYDLVIKQGFVVDGSGLPGRQADIGVMEGRIAAIGRIQGPADRVLNADGLVVAPGFIDIHTHYDAQVNWDALLLSAPWHGFTTVVMGNCGYTLAPCRPQDRDYVMRMFARVEGVTYDALKQGLGWEWVSFPEYLNWVEKRPKALNVAGMVGHSAIRLFVMGEASLEKEATAEEIRLMQEVVREAMRAGAFGFSSSKRSTHFDGEGRPVPSRQATSDEIVALASVLGEFHVGNIEIINRSALQPNPRGFDEEDERLLTRLSVESGRPVNWNALGFRADLPDAWRGQIAYMDRAGREGAAIYAVAGVAPATVPFNFLRQEDDVRLNPFCHWPGWKEFIVRTPSAKLGLLQDVRARAALRAEAEAGDLGLRPESKLGQIVLAWSRETANKKWEGKTLDQIGGVLGKPPVEAMLEIIVEEKLETEFYPPANNRGEGAIEEIIRHPRTVVGISDGGAHVDRLSGSRYATYFLAHWVRARGTVSLEEGIRRLTFMPASIYGIRDRGLIREGMAADMVLIDLAKVKPLPTERFHDLPGGGLRLGNRAEGIQHLIVNGRVVMSDGVDTGARPGVLLRSSAS